MSRPIARSLEHIAGLVGTLVVVVILSACSKKEAPSPAETGVDSVAGTLSYRELTTLSDDAVVEVELADVSVADGPAEIVSSQRIRKSRAVPRALQA